MLLEKRTTLPQRILRQIRIETHQSECRIIDQSQRRKTDQSGDWKKARCKRVVVAVGGNCTRAMCVRVRRCQCSSTESARSPPQRLYIADQFVRWSRRVILLLQSVSLVTLYFCIYRVSLSYDRTPHTSRARFSKLLKKILGKWPNLRRS